MRLQWTQTAAAMAMCCGVVAAAERGNFSDKGVSIRQVSFGPGSSAPREPTPVPKIRTKAKSDGATKENERPLLLSAEFSGGTVLIPPPPAPGPAAPHESASVSEPTDAAPTSAAALSIIPPPTDGPSVSLLYPHVSYKGTRHVAAGGVPMIIAMPDPCQDGGQVYVRILVPPNCDPKVKCEKGGREVQYDFGKYEVAIKSKHGVVTVAYSE